MAHTTGEVESSSYNCAQIPVLVFRKEGGERAQDYSQLQHSKVIADILNLSMRQGLNSNQVYKAGFGHQDIPWPLYFLQKAVGLRECGTFRKLG